MVSECKAGSLLVVVVLVAAHVCAGRESNADDQMKAAVVAPSDLMNERFEAIRSDPKNNAMCGVNCLYLFIRAIRSDRPVTLQDVRKVVSVTEQGSTLAQLKAGAEKLGMATRAVQCPTSKLDELPLPAIGLIEPNNLENFVAHYVLLIKVTGKSVTYIDPTFGEVIYERGDYARWATGFYLIDDQTRSSKWYIGIFAVGCAFIGVALFDRKRQQRHKKVHSENSVVLSVICCFIVGMSGCYRPESGTSYGPPRSLEFDGPLHRHLGLISPSTDTTTTFAFQSARKSDIKLSVGQPSCGCLQVALTPQKKLEPGGKGSLRMSLRTSETTGGPVEATVAVGIEDENETYELSLAAFVEGIVGAKYVLRPHQLRKGNIPDLTLIAYTESKDVEIEITGVTPRDPFSREVHEELEVDVVHAKTGEARTYPDSGCQREIKLPVHIRDVRNMLEGEFAIKYLLRGREREAVVPYYIIVE